jgi:hypothetical protein
MEKKIKRIYVDSTVVSGMFDYHMPERVKHTTQFWDAVQRGEFVVIASDVLEEEQEEAPKCVRDFFDGLSEAQIERVESTDESDRLATPLTEKDFYDDERFIFDPKQYPKSGGR